ncbi:MAG: hypothetical protein GTN71_19635 [Anaerolineae bacterium]|nr:hypothetical protein [Anaerolineae bacterium]
MIADGWDVVIIARQPMREASSYQVDRAVDQLLRRARLLKAAEGITGDGLSVALSEG